MKRAFAMVLLSGLMAFLPGCNSGTGADSQVAEGGIGGTGITPTGVSSGTITGFGSVIVNGTRFDTSEATITVDGQQVSEAALEVGFAVRVTGDIATAKAASVESTETVRGPVAAVVINDLDKLSATISVLGQTVRTDELTNFDGFDLATLTVGQVVGISGLRTASGIVSASYITLRSGGEQVVGEVTSLTTSTFSIAGLVIDFSGANLASLPGGQLQEGQLVEVRGSLATAGSPAMLTATDIASFDFFSVQPDDDVEIEGFVTSVAAGTTMFRIGPVAVATTAATQFVDGLLADIVLDARVEVEGVIDTSGQLQAEKITIKPTSSVRIEASVDSTDTGAATVTILGITVETDASTRFSDDSDADLESLRLSDLNPGDQLSVKGFLSDGVVTATRIDREDSDDDEQRVQIRGPVEFEDTLTGAVRILGVTVSGRTDLGTVFEDLSDDVISQAEFYGEVETGTLVNVRWEPFVSTDEAPTQLSLSGDDDVDGEEDDD